MTMFAVKGDALQTQTVRMRLKSILLSEKAIESVPCPCGLRQLLRCCGIVEIARGAEDVNSASWL